MARLPFKADQMAPRAEPAPARGDRAFTVSEAASLIRGALAAGTPTPIRVVGEVSNFTQRSHWFFSLKDAQATLRCVCFASTARKCKAALVDGMQVVVTGRLDYYDAQGQVQLYADAIEPVGQGALEMRFRALCEELRGLGYFDPATKLPLPSFPRRIAVVTSRSGAALQDVINTARRRFGGSCLLLYDVRVQGAQAAPEVAEAIRHLSRDGRRLGIEAIILTRGGGSIEDLWAFNERVVADAIHACAIPIVAAIGHETDTTIAELVADARCATPTQAAMALVPDAAALLMQTQQYGRRLTLLLRRSLDGAEQRLTNAARQPLFRRPQTLVRTAREQLDRLGTDLSASLHNRLRDARHKLAERQHDLATLEPRARLRLATQTLTELSARLTRATGQRLQTSRAKLDALQRHLDAVGPRRVLDRGYSYTLGPDGKVLRDAEQVAAGDRITSVLSRGRVTSRVEMQSRPSTPAPRRVPRSAPPSLFDAPEA